MFTGYLKPIRLTQKADSGIHAEMAIPNTEVKTIYRDNIMHWLQDEVNESGTSVLFDAIISGDTEKFEDEVNDWLLKCISYQDGYEHFYHGFLSGLLLGKVGKRGYSVKSNRESGLGRSDIMICEVQKASVAVIIEVKAAGSRAALDDKCDEALKQIEDKKYAADLVADGYKNIIKYGVAFYKKSCMIKKE